MKCAHDSSKKTSTEAHRNTESITFVSSFLNIIQLGVFNFLFTTSGLCTGWLMKEATN